MEQTYFQTQLVLEWSIVIVVVITSYIAFVDTKMVNNSQSKEDHQIHKEAPEKKLSTRYV